MTPTIKRRRLLSLTALAITLCAAPVAAAHDAQHEHRGAVVAPANGKWAGEFWAQIYSLPLSRIPSRATATPA
jgi:fucose permease